MSCLGHISSGQDAHAMGRGCVCWPAYIWTGLGHALDIDVPDQGTYVQATGDGNEFASATEEAFRNINAI